MAVKLMVMSNLMDGAAKRERMAIMEAAISSSLSHPNLVQTFTYSLSPIRDTSSTVVAGGVSPSAEGIVGSGYRVFGDASGASSPDSNSLEPRDPGPLPQFSGFEVRLVLEYCDKGSLRDLLDSRPPMPGAREKDYMMVLELANDIARGMLHLHSVNVVHSDLKAHNVMIKSSTSNACGLVAKVADFGLSVKMDHAATHVSDAFGQCTLTHAPPEMFTDGIQSRAGDV